MHKKGRPLLEYASPVWGDLPKYLADVLKHVQNRSLDIIGISRTTKKEGRKEATKREVENILNDRKHPNRISISNPIVQFTIIIYHNLRSKPSYPTIPI